MTSTASEHPALSRRTRGGLVCLFSGLLLGLLGTLFELLVASSIARLISFQATYAALTILQVGTAVVLLVGLFRCGELPADSETRLFVWMTLIGWLLIALLQLFSLGQIIGSGPYSAGVSRGNCSWSRRARRGTGARSSVGSGEPSPFRESPRKPPLSCSGLSFRYCAFVTSCRYSQNPFVLRT